MKSVFTCRAVLKIIATIGVSQATATILLFNSEMSTASKSEKGGLIRLESKLNGTSDQLDPPLFDSTIDHTRSSIADNSLVHFDEDLATRPRLAKSVEPNCNASKWTFKLRQGVVLHDGSLFSTGNAIYSMD